MAEITAIEVVCQATGLTQSNVADRASASLANDRQTHPGTSQRKFRKNTLQELRRKRLRRNKACKDKMRNMSKTEKRTYFKHKITTNLESLHNEEIALLKNAAVETKRKAVFFWRKWKATQQLSRTCDRDYNPRYM